jgi:2-amino-4-hydroxy-6-hydroxymethyldihydropteridine diphosphokinase
MKSQNQVILSIGSNQGDRHANITQCIDLIHHQMGTVIGVSKLYETPSWGFDSNAFYNAAVAIHTYKSPEQVLNCLLAIEKQLGRVRNGQPGYQARTIDIDIISFNNDLIETESLQIPHPQMQHRLFVLLPMNDLSIAFVHPILKKTVTELIDNCQDKSECQLILDLKGPLANVDLQQFRFIAIEGNIGVGKTTLTTKIAEDFKAKTVLERFADNSFLPKFYQDQSRYAFSLELSFLMDRHEQLSSDMAQFDWSKDCAVGDYHFFKSLIFAKVTLPEDEFQLYSKVFEMIDTAMPQPGLFLYLYQNTERLLQQIKERGRSYEQDISAAYLDKINEGYLSYIQSQTNLNVLVIDVSDLDFVKNQGDYISILEAIQRKINA